MLQEQFVTKEIALKLRELGFNEECFGYYSPYRDTVSLEMKISNSKIITRASKRYTSKGSYDKLRVAAPLWQQANRFLTSKLRDLKDYDLEFRQLIEYKITLVTQNGSSRD